MKIKLDPPHTSSSSVTRCLAKTAPRHAMWTSLLALGFTAACSNVSTSDDPRSSGSGGASHAEANGGAGGGTASDDGGTVNFDPCSACGYGSSCDEHGVCESELSCLTGADCAAGLECDTDSGACVPDEQCGEQVLNSTVVGRDIFIVLDRSCSMKHKIGSKKKWRAAVEAVNAFVAADQADTRFGLELFPSVGSCGIQDVAIPLSKTGGTELTALLSSALDSSDPNNPTHGPCRTPTAHAMDVAAEQSFVTEEGRSKYILLITDGKTFPCNKNVEPANLKVLNTIEQLAQDPQHAVKTIVVGFGGKTDPDQLNLWAEAGGMAAEGESAKFYSAETPDSLNQILATVSQKTTGCEHALTETPPDAERLYVYFDQDTQVSRDETHVDGWDYDASHNRVKFYGAACETLQQGQIDDVAIVFGCPPDAPK